MGFGGLCPFPLRLGQASIEEVSPEQWARATADTAAIVAAAPLAWVTLAYDAPTVTVVAFQALYSGALSLAPSAAEVAAGHLRITFDSSYLDPYGKRYPISLRGGKATAWNSVGSSDIPTVLFSTQALDVYGVPSANNPAVSILVY